jgi:hypothetical protein
MAINLFGLLTLVGGAHAYSTDFSQGEAIMNPGEVCPSFVCESDHNGISMDDQVFCYKHDVQNPFRIKLKNCLAGQFCHANLNRCAMDPYS